METMASIGPVLEASAALASIAAFGLTACALGLLAAGDNGARDARSVSATSFSLVRIPATAGRGRRGPRP
jgi:hypothetical protein